MHKKMTLIWFLLGFGSRLQVVASLSITEIIVLAFAPYLFFKGSRQMSRDGIMPLFVLSVLVIVGCVIASIANHTRPEYILRGMAVTSIVACAIIFSHWILRRDPAGFKWFVLALPVSAIVSTYYFKASVEVSMLGESAEEIMSGPIFLISRIGPLVLAPIKGWYLYTPILYSIFAPIVFAVFSVFITVSGRSTALGAIAFAAFVIIGGRSQRRMNRIPRHFWKLCFLGVFLIGALYTAYKVSASRGWLGEDARKKYENQTDAGQGGIGRLILGGRGESFIGLLACRDKPIIGWGPWAMDENDYAEEFMRKYGTYEDFQDCLRHRSLLLSHGIASRMLPCHAYITEFWAWYGIWGLIFWLYVIFVLIRYLKQDVAAVPQWYAWLACSVPSVLWGIFFSPFADRVGVPLFVVACLMARSARKGSFHLPSDMVAEIRRLNARA